MKKSDKNFEENLIKALNSLGYSDFNLELGENDLYNLIFKKDPISLRFDNFRYIGNSFIMFEYKGQDTLALWKKETNKEIIIVNTHIKSTYNLKKYEENIEKIRKLIKVDKIESITEIAKNLGMTRQALYKNKELKKYIDNLKKC